MRSVIVHQKQRLSGFTLLEVVVTLSIVGLLLSLTLPAVQMSREASRKTRCQSNLRQFGLAVVNYHDVNQMLPMGSSRVSGSTFFKGSWGFTAALLPYLEERSTYAALRFAVNDCCQFAIDLQSSGNNLDPFSKAIELLVCPTDPQSGMICESGPPYSFACGRLRTTSYLGVSGKHSFNCVGTARGDGLLFSKSAIRFAQVTDGTSSTLLIGERGVPEHLVWGWPLCGGTECEHYLGVEQGLRRRLGNSHRQFWSWHPSGVHFLFADGHVRSLSMNIDQVLLESLSTRSTGEVVAGF